jgi:dihydrodipicolinate synthase/N-acetylneuraminate lyase
MTLFRHRPNRGLKFEAIACKISTTRTAARRAAWRPRAWNRRPCFRPVVIPCTVRRAAEEPTIRSPDLPAGIVVPLMTPFDTVGEVDLPMLRRLVGFYVSAGVQAIFTIGSAGQGLVMTSPQRRAALEAVMEECAGKVPVVAHIGTAESFSSRDLARHAARCGVAAIAIVPPYYYSDHTEFEILCHFREVADAAPGLPVVVYDNPKYSGIQCSPALVLKLREQIPRVAGIKVAFAKLDEILAYADGIPNFSVYAGSVQHLAEHAPHAIAGAINPPSSAFPELCVELWRAVSMGSRQDAVRLQARLNALSAVVSSYIQHFGRGAFMEVMRMRGFPIVRYPRWTTHRFSEEEREQLRAALIDAGADLA